LKDLIDTAAKAKLNYDKASKEADAGREAHRKAEADLKGAPDNKKFQQAVPKAEANKKKLEDKAAQLDTVYQNAVRTANEMQTKVYEEEMPRLLGELQKVFEDTFRTVEKLLNAFVDIHAVSLAQPPPSEVQKEGNTTPQVSIGWTHSRYCLPTNPLQ
jgi:hypothetical protein